MAQVVECLPHKYKALSGNFSFSRERKRDEKIKAI
jgi:hypothetical protein